MSKQKTKSKPVKVPARRLGYAHLTLARACEASVDGSAPRSFRILASGTNETDKGPLVFTPTSAKLVMDAWNTRGNPLVIYYEHEDRLPLEKRGGAPMKGAAAAPSADLATPGPADAPECWAQNVAWTAEANRQIVSGERRQISPVAAYDEDTREVVEILNVSLCGEGATHHGTLLASRDSERSSIVDELIDSIMAALESGDFETAETLVQKAEAMAGDDAGMTKMVKMAKAACKAAKPAPPAPQAPQAPQAQTKRLAASRETLVQAGVDVGAIDRSVGEFAAATREAKAAALDSRKATVEMLITMNRDLFDPADEREHVTAADPTATRRHIASLSRKVKDGTIALNKPGASQEARPGGAKPGDATKDEELTPGEKIQMDSYNRGERDPKKHLTPTDIIRSRKTHSGAAPSVGKA